MVAQEGQNVGTHADGHVDGAFPIGLQQHIEHHQFVLEETLLALQRDGRWADGDAVGIDGHILHPALLVVFVAQTDGQGWRVVCRTLHLVDIPVGLQVFHINDACIGAHSFHLMVIPKRESVVIAVGQDDGMSLSLHAVKVVGTEVTTGITA